MESRPPADVTTLDPPHGKQRGHQRVIGLALTIIYHVDAARIGWRARLPLQGDVDVSRLEPVFRAPRGEGKGALDDPHISRKPFRLQLELGRATVHAGDSIVVDGERSGAPASFDAERLAAGVVLELGDRAVLLLHAIEPADTAADELGLVGESDGINAVRKQILRVADHAIPVLIRGESGTGKELVAAAIHQRSSRNAGEFVSVNLAAVPSSTVAAALFGHTRGAFTGAVQASDGYFGAADRGTIFLDEVGSASDEVQAALLRVLETGELQAVGASRPHKVDVRLIAATDADLDRALEDGQFRLPLMMRLAGFELHIPPLRARRDDIARLLFHFVREELERIGRPERFEKPADGQPVWLPPWVIVAALAYRWPGNVRQLRNLARQMVINDADELTVRNSTVRDTLLRDEPEASAAAPAPSEMTSARAKGKRRLLDDISEEALLEALQRNDFKPGRAASALGVSRTSFYELMKRFPHARKAADLERGDIEQALASSGGDVSAAATALEVSERGLQLRMKALGLEP